MELFSAHPHELLPLESALPVELQYASRDHYRIILTMTLSASTSDFRLTRALQKLFNHYQDFLSLKNLQKDELKDALATNGIGWNDPNRSGNGGRLWSLLTLYFGPRSQEITEPKILALKPLIARGFGSKMRKVLQAYCFGNKNVFPMDRAAFNALKDFGFYEGWSKDKARDDVERKLPRFKSGTLIDFHEMLRFRKQVGQVQKGSPNTKQREVIMGWNGWRLLCSSHRGISKPEWIYRHLVQDKQMARELFNFVRGNSAFT